MIDGLRHVKKASAPREQKTLKHLLILLLILEAFKAFKISMGTYTFYIKLAYFICRKHGRCRLQSITSSISIKEAFRGLDLFFGCSMSEGTGSQRETQAE